MAQEFHNWLTIAGPYRDRIDFIASALGHCPWHWYEVEIDVEAPISGDAGTSKLDFYSRDSPKGLDVRSGTNGPPIRAPKAPEPTHENPGVGSVLRPPKRSPEFITLSEFAPQEVEWLWRIRIPRGEITVLEGDPSVNKSTLVLDLAARVSAGRGMPDDNEEAEGGVLLLPGEDSLRKTVLQRLTAEGLT